ncbi:MAG: hypothetical protein NZ551_07275 [Microscillaceae bacterium]|nr:hypothetical protein [Microscillaceae bacterium]MDW8460995.1 hypothetical protein [Cytophagales bacterium]
MVEIKFQTSFENVDQVVNLLKSSGLVHNLQVEDDDDQKLKPMTLIDFYKKINASNLAERERRVFSQKQVREEVATW